MSIFIQAALRAAHNRKRRCPICGREQYVSAEQTEMTILCHHCNSPIPPQRRPISRQHPPYSKQ